MIAADVAFDGDSIRERCTVELVGTRIGRCRFGLGPQEYRTAQEAADVTAPFLMPGLIDSHVHITGYRDGIPAGNPYEPHKHFLRMCVLNGVTTVRDVGNSLEALEYLRQWTCRYAGPDVFGSGPLLDTPPFTWPFSRVVRDADSARRQVGLLADEGVDLLKAYRNIEPATLTSIVECARERDLDVAIDAGRTPVLQACRAGVRSVEHVLTLTTEHGLGTECNSSAGATAAVRAWRDVDVNGPTARELREAFLAARSFLVPTLLVSRRWTFFDEMVAEPHNDLMTLVMPYHSFFNRMRGTVGMRIGRRMASRFIPIQALTRTEHAEAMAGLDRMREMVAALAGDGVPLAVGTDSPNPSIVPGFGLHRELRELTLTGIPVVDLLRAATAGGARLIRRDDRGVLREGAQADLLLLAGDPRQDIGNTERIQQVVKAGALVDRAALDKVLREAAGER